MVVGVATWKSRREALAGLTAKRNSELWFDHEGGRGYGACVAWVACGCSPFRVQLCAEGEVLCEGDLICVELAAQFLLR